MNIIPIELWRIIMSMSKPKSQQNIKLSCKCLYDNLSFNNRYLNAILREAAFELEKVCISFDDILRYLIRKNNYSKYKYCEMVSEMTHEKNCIIANCNAHLLIEYGTHGDVICKLCNSLYSCPSCYNVGVINDDGQANKANCEIRKCKLCSRLLKVYICLQCDEIIGNCKCNGRVNHNYFGGPQVTKI